MIKPEDLRTGDLVRVSRDCAFPKGTICVVTDIRPEKVFKDKKGYDVRPSNVLLLTLIDERIRRAERIVRKFSRAIPPEPLGREI